MNMTIPETVLYVVGFVLVLLYLIFGIDDVIWDLLTFSRKNLFRKNHLDLNAVKDTPPKLLAMCIAAGAAWIALKAPLGSELRKRAVNQRFIFQVASVVIFLLISLYGHFIIRPEMAPELGVVRWACAILFVLGMGAAIYFGGNGNRDLRTFVAQSVAAVALVFLLATSMFPNLVVASANSVGPSITVATAASSDLALTWMTGIACIGVPLVLAYHVVAYRIFRGRLALSEKEAE